MQAGKKSEMSSPRARGRDEVRAALLSASADLFADRGPTAVSLRDIASRAGVNHGLIHRHFGSKEGLLRETLEALAEQIAIQLEDANADPKTGLRVLDTVVERSPYWRILARLLLDGVPVSEIQSRFPVVERMLAERGAASDDTLDRKTRLDVASLLSISLGWLVFEPFIVEATGLGGEDASALRSEIILSAGKRMRSS
jgi:AcrR family transcriptional regulator